MIVVHHLENSRSQRILWLLEELKLPYTVKRYARDPRTMLAPKELRRVHPLGKSPVIEDGQLVIAESGAIVEYLVEKAGGKLGSPEGQCGKLRYRQFLHYAEGSLMPPLLVMLVIKRLGILGLPARKPIQRMLDRHLDYCDQELSGRPFFAGEELTGADIMMSFPLEAAAKRAGLNASRRHVWAWLQRVHERPTYQRALRAGGPYDYA